MRGLRLLQHLMRALDIKPASLVVLVSVALIAGGIEDEMAPFRSFLYMLVLLFIFHGSVTHGPVQGLFLASGFLMLRLMGSAFRPPDIEGSFAGELLADSFLFSCLGFLPGFIVLIHEQGLEDAKLELAEAQARMRVQRTRSQEEIQARRQAARSGTEDDRADMRRGNSVAELVRNGLGAGNAGELLEGLAAALAHGGAIQRCVVLAPSPASGDLELRPVHPPDGVRGRVPGELPLVRKVREMTRPLVLDQPEDLGGDVLADILVPLAARTGAAGIVGLKLAPEADRDLELRYVTAMQKIAQGLATRMEA